MYLIKLIIIFIMLIFLICLIKKNKVENYNKEKDKLCKRLYKDKDNKDYKIIKNLFSKNYCNYIIKESEIYASKYKWKKKRHEDYPTVDNEITKKWSIYNDIYTIVSSTIFTEIAKLYNINKNDLGINEIFIVKYNTGGQTELAYHEDGSEFSFIIALNDKFTGGGTTFKFNKKNIQLSIGDCLIFSGQNTHKGNEIITGTRYILTGFLNYKKGCNDD